MRDQYNLKKVVECIGGETIVSFIKGDVPGHEFHGNQYIAGGGDALYDKLHAANENWAGTKVSAEKLNEVRAYMEGKKSIGTNKLMDNLNLSAGMAAHLNTVRNEHFKSQGGSKTQTQAERIGRYLSQTHIGLIRRK